MDPELTDALAHHRAGRLAEAAPLYERVLRRDPAQADALRLLARVRIAEGKAEAGIPLLEEAIRRRPRFPEAELDLGDAWQRRGRLEQAVAAYRRALALDPGLALAHNHLGIALQAQGDREAAAAAFAEAIRLDPRNFEALSNLGHALQGQGKFVPAEEACRRALALNPLAAEIHNNLGNALQGLKRTEEALAAYDRALELKPDFPEAHNNRGNVLKALHRLAEAESAYRRALGLRPAYADAWNNLGNAQLAQGRMADAVASYRKSREAQPAQGDAYFYEGLARLAAGELVEGFALYEHRWRSEMRDGIRSLPARLWLGREPLAGKSILLHAEQGLGDTLQFIRYLSAVAERGASAALEVQPALAALVRGLPGAGAVYARGDALPPFDFHCPLLSLPHAFGTGLATIPARVPYLRADPDRAEAWRRRLGCGGEPKIGVVWAGNPRHKHDTNRSIALETLRPLLGAPGRRFYSLQKEVPPADAVALAACRGRPGFTDLSAELRDFGDTAAAVDALDLVIAVDTSVAHLAGALGRPTWILLPFFPDWRWMREREDTPWYPTARLFRQREPGRWDDVLLRVAEALRSL